MKAEGLAWCESNGKDSVLVYRVTVFGLNILKLPGFGSLIDVVVAYEEGHQLGGWRCCLLRWGETFLGWGL